jgi:hypothetical protein
MKTERQTDINELFGPVIHTYTRQQAIEDGVLVDVTEMAKQAGLKYPTAITRAVFDEYVRVPEALADSQDEIGRIWDVLWMMRVAIQRGEIQGDRGMFKVIVAKPGPYRSNEEPLKGDTGCCKVTLKSICGPSDDGSPCISILMPGED